MMKCQWRIITECEEKKEERIKKIMRKESKAGKVRKAEEKHWQNKIVLSRHTISYSSGDSIIHLPHYITTFPSYTTTSTWLHHCHVMAFALVVRFPLLSNVFLEKRSSLVPGNCFHFRALVFTLWAQRHKHLHAPEQTHRLSAFPRGTVPQGRLGRQLGSVPQELKTTFMLTRAAFSFAHHATMKLSRSGMTHLYSCHDNVTLSAECCSEQPCFLAAVGWQYSKYNHAKEFPLVVVLHCIDPCKTPSLKKSRLVALWLFFSFLGWTRWEFVHLKFWECCR